VPSLLDHVSPYSAQATFNDSRAAMARRKQHSTVSEALCVARRLQAKLTVLTHFSQRCAAHPPHLLRCVWCNLRCACVVCACLVCMFVCCSVTGTLPCPALSRARTVPQAQPLVQPTPTCPYCLRSIACVWWCLLPTRVALAQHEGGLRPGMRPLVTAAASGRNATAVVWPEVSPPRKPCTLCSRHQRRQSSREAHMRRPSLHMEASRPRKPLRTL